MKFQITKRGLNGTVDVIDAEILEDGLIKSTTTGSISSVNHQNAADYLTSVSRLAGGVEKIEKRKKESFLAQTELQTVKQS